MAVYYGTGVLKLLRGSDALRSTDYVSPSGLSYNALVAVARSVGVPEGADYVVTFRHEPEAKNFVNRLRVVWFFTPDEWQDYGYRTWCEWVSLDQAAPSSSGPVTLYGYDLSTVKPAPTTGQGWSAPLSVSEEG